MQIAHSFALFSCFPFCCTCDGKFIFQKDEDKNYFEIAIMTNGICTVYVDDFLSQTSQNHTQYLIFMNISV